MISKTVTITKREARAILAALDWCECDFELGKSQQSFCEKLHDLFPDLPHIFKHKPSAISQ